VAIRKASPEIGECIINYELDKDSGTFFLEYPLNFLHTALPFCVSRVKAAIF